MAMVPSRFARRGRVNRSTGGAEAGDVLTDITATTSDEELDRIVAELGTFDPFEDLLRDAVACMEWLRVEDDEPD